jgi:hypothetical protein
MNMIDKSVGIEFPDWIKALTVEEFFKLEMSIIWYFSEFQKVSLQWNITKDIDSKPLSDTIKISTKLDLPKSMIKPLLSKS